LPHQSIEVKMNQESNTQILFPEAAQELMENSAWVEQLLAHVDAIKISRGAKRNKEISLLENKILIRLNTRSNRELINQKVDDLFRGLRTILNEEFPTLTKNELLFCCYLKLDLQTETIATLKGVDPSSISMTTYRIKKKMALPEDTRLINFIKSL